MEQQIQWLINSWIQFIGNHQIQQWNQIEVLQFLQCIGIESDKKQNGKQFLNQLPQYSGLLSLKLKHILERLNKKQSLDITLIKQTKRQKNIAIYIPLSYLTQIVSFSQKQNKKLIQLKKNDIIRICQTYGIIQNNFWLIQKYCLDGYILLHVIPNNIIKYVSNKQQQRLLIYLSDLFISAWFYINRYKRSIRSQKTLENTSKLEYYQQEDDILQKRTGSQVRVSLAVSEFYQPRGVSVIFSQREQLTLSQYLNYEKQEQIQLIEKLNIYKSQLFQQQINLPFNPFDLQRKNELILTQYQNDIQLRNKKITFQGATIGRNQSCQILYPIDQFTVSNFHCYIGFDTQLGFYIQDKNSKAGTYLQVNNQYHIKQQTILQIQQKLQLLMKPSISQLYITCTKPHNYPASATIQLPLTETLFIGKHPDSVFPPKDIQKYINNFGRLEWRNGVYYIGQGWIRLAQKGSASKKYKLAKNDKIKILQKKNHFHCVTKLQLLI